MNRNVPQMRRWCGNAWKQHDELIINRRELTMLKRLWRRGHSYWKMTLQCPFWVTELECRLRPGVRPVAGPHLLLSWSSKHFYIHTPSLVFLFPFSFFFFNSTVHVVVTNFEAHTGIQNRASIKKKSSIKWHITICQLEIIKAVSQ